MFKLNQFLEQHYEVSIKDDVRNRFSNLYKSRPIKKNHGGCDEEGCFLIFAILDVLNPSCVIESGVWYGQTTWVIKRAAPKSKVYSFDIRLDRRVHIEDSVTYIENDWSTYDIQETGKTVCLFDDHVDHSKRIQEAYNRGFKTLIFDDDFPLEELKNRNAPPVPTIKMLLGDKKKYESSNLILDYVPLPKKDFMTLVRLI